MAVPFFEILFQENQALRERPGSSGPDQRPSYFFVPASIIRLSSSSTSAISRSQAVFAASHMASLLTTNPPSCSTTVRRNAVGYAGWFDGVNDHTVMFGSSWTMVQPDWISTLTPFLLRTESSAAATDGYSRVGARACAGACAGCAAAHVAIRMAGTIVR